MDILVIVEFVSFLHDASTIIVTKRRAPIPVSEGFLCLLDPGGTNTSTLFIKLIKLGLFVQ